MEPKINRFQSKLLLKKIKLYYTEFFFFSLIRIIRFHVQKTRRRQTIECFFNMGSPVPSNSRLMISHYIFIL